LIDVDKMKLRNKTDKKLSYRRETARQLCMSTGAG